MSWSLQMLTANATSASLTANTILYTWRCAAQKRLLSGKVRVMSNA